MQDTQELKFQVVCEIAKLVRDFIIRKYGDSGGMCVDATRYILRLLTARGIEAKCYEGKVKFKCPRDGFLRVDGYHVWLEVDGIIVDVTADQFNEPTMEFPPILIAPPEHYPEYQERKEIAFLGAQMEQMQSTVGDKFTFDIGPLAEMVG